MQSAKSGKVTRVNIPDRWTVPSGPSRSICRGAIILWVFMFGPQSHHWSDAASGKEKKAGARECEVRPHPCYHVYFTARPDCLRGVTRVPGRSSWWEQTQSLAICSIELSLLHDVMADYFLFNLYLVFKFWNYSNFLTSKLWAMCFRILYFYLTLHVSTPKRSWSGARTQTYIILYVIQGIIEIYVNG